MRLPLVALLSLSTFASSLLAGAPARADQLDADRATARLLAQEGKDALVAKDYAKAADRFRRAEALLHAPTLQLGLALAEVGLGHLVAAQEIYRRIVREGAPPNASAAFVKAVEDAKTELATLEPRVPLLTLEVTGAAAPEVLLDGAVVPVAAIGVPRPVDPGSRVVRVRADGKKTVEVTVSLQERQRLTVPIKLEDEVVLAPAPKPPPAPPPAPPPPPVVERPAGMPAIAAVGVAAVALGASGLVAGAVTGGLAIAKHDELARDCPGGRCGPEVSQGRLDEYAALGNAATWSLVVGGTVAAAGVVLVAVSPRRRPPVTPVVGPASVGLAGRF